MPQVRAVLEVVALGLVRTVDDLEGRFARRSTAELIASKDIKARLRYSYMIYR